MSAPNPVSATTATLLSDDGYTSPTIRGRLRSNRGLIIIGVMTVLVSVLLALAHSSRVTGMLDPDATDPSGSHALATLLRDQGVTVIRVTDTATAVSALAQAPGATLVITPRAPVSDRMATEILRSSYGRLVLLGPDTSTLDLLAPWASADTDLTSTDDVPADCAWDVAQRAGAIPATGMSYTTSRTDASVCWGGAVIDAPASASTPGVTIIGAYPALTNDALATSGNASMALGALGRNATVVWWLPSEADPLQFSQSEPPSIEALVPSWVSWAFVQLVLAMVVVIWWRGRRLGRIVVEPLPVVVRATESVEGRARLYRRGRARGRASDLLRDAALGRLRARLSLPRTATTETVIEAVSVRTGRPTTEVTALLARGSDPTDDASLARLADELDILENVVRRA